MFNATARNQKLQRAIALFEEGNDFLMRLMVDDMMERLSAIKRDFENAIALFGRTAYLAEQMAASPQIKNIIRVEEAQHLGHCDHIASPDLLGLEPESADLIIAPLCLHWSNDLPGTLIQLRQTLRPDGLLMLVLPSPQTLYELRQALLMSESEARTGAGLRVDPFTDIRDAGALLQRAGYALPVVDQEVQIVRYDHALALIADLRCFAATTQLQSRENNPPLTPSIIARLCDIYSDKFSDPDGRIRASFGFTSMIGWVPHASQQKPLQPGSAKTRLADALKTDEIKL